MLRVAALDRPEVRHEALLEGSLEYVQGAPKMVSELTGDELLGVAYTYKQRAQMLMAHAERLERYMEAP